MQLIDFELYIIDMLENNGIESGEELTAISFLLHEAVENAMYDYALDNDIYDDYEPSY